MNRRTDCYQRVFSRLFAHFGPQHWWPGDGPLEIAIGAVLTQNASWRNVEKAIDGLKECGALTFGTLLAMPESELAAHIRPAGYYNLKARRLKNLLVMVAERYQGEFELLLADDMAVARENLLSVTGVGPETADSILLYAGNHPVFVIDAYTHRVFARHGLAAEEASYEELQEDFMERLEPDASLYNEYHALIVMVAKEFCKKSKPLCTGCPLQNIEEEC